MPDVRLTPLGYYHYHYVESTREIIEIMGVNKLPCHRRNMFLFVVVNRLLSLNEFFAFSGLDLDEYHRLIIPHNQIDFALLDGVITLQNPVSTLLEIFLCQLFSSLPQLVSFPSAGHNLRTLN